MREHIVRWMIDGIERGYVPDSLTRWGMRQLLSQRLRRMEAVDVPPDASAELEQRKRKFVSSMKMAPIAPVPEKANVQHYEVPSDLFGLMLGPRRKYSCCWWPDGVDTLDLAEEAALQETCRHAELENGMTVLDLGCGWGSLSLWILENYPDCSVTAVSNSTSQRDYIRQQARERGVADRIDVRTCDMNEFDASTRFSRVISVEMFEHMRNYERLLSRITGWLIDDGKLLVHVFCHRRHAYEFLEDGAANWMGRYFFSGGIMPSHDLLYHFNRDLQVTGQWNWNGTHYQKTAEAWVARIDEHRDRILPLLARCYGGDEQRWLQRWRMLFLAGAELFGYRDGKEWFVTHCLLEPQRSRMSTVPRPSKTPSQAAAGHVDGLGKPSLK